MIVVFLFIVIIGYLIYLKGGYNFDNFSYDIENKTEEKIYKVKDLKKVNIIFFDTETNGLEKESSVLSIAALKGYIDLESGSFVEKERYQRYYYPKEAFNEEAININGLSEVEIDRLRENKKANYSKYFSEDLCSFYEFIEGVEHFVAHNIKFDSMFIKKPLKVKFCTMLTNTSIVKAKRFRNGKYKWPKLEEAAEYFNVGINHENLHDSLYDVKLTVKVFESMLKHRRGKEYTKRFLIENKSYLIEI